MLNTEKCFKLTIALIVLVGTSIISSGQKVLVEKLPQVEDFTATFLDKPTKAGNVVLSLKFSGRERLPETFAIKLDKKRLIEFSDSGENTDNIKGDGIFTGQAFFKEEEILTPHIMRGGTFPVFSGRQFLGYKEFPPIEKITPNVPITINSLGDPSNIDAERSLLIRHPRVVQDPTRTRAACDQSSMGKWSFGYLMTQMANEPLTGINPSDFTLKWLQNWERDQVVNNFTVPERRAGVLNLIAKWKKERKGGRLDLSQSPFRLLAIVNRVDLRGSFIYGQEESDNAGELRFVFGLVDPETCQSQRFTVIFEFGVKKDSCGATQEWAVRWKKLDQLELGSPEYNRELEYLTEEIVKANADPRKPNGSALNQLRTNDFVFSRPWELREFQLEGDVSFLNEATTKQTPDASINGTRLLTEFINQFENDILSSTHVVPLDYNGNSFLGGGIRYDSGDFWNSDGINNNQARHQFSLATCNSCHARETDTGFLHITPVNFGNVTVPLSGFLTGSTPSTSDIEFLSVSDPVDTTARDFNDLLRRAADLDMLVSTPCERRFAAPQGITMTH